MMSSTRKYTRLLCAALAAAPVCAWTFTPSSELRVGEEGALVAFILPELESCKKLESHWSAVKEKEPAFAVDCAAEPEYCLEQEVHSHPAIRAYFPGGYTRYRGPREADDIVAFLNRIRKPVVQEPPPPTFLTSDDITILALLPADDPLGKVYKDVAARYSDRYAFGLQEADKPALRCRNNPDELEYSLDDLGRISAVEEFVRKCGVKLVREMSRRSESSIMQTGKSIVHYLPTSAPDKTAYTTSIRPLAKAYAEFLLFVTVNGEEYPDMAASLGHKPDARGVLSVRNTHTGDVYPMSGAVTAEGVEGFILGISRGEVPAWDGVLREGVVHDEL